MRQFALIFGIAAALLAVSMAEQSGEFPDFPFFGCRQSPSAYSLNPVAQQVGPSSFCFTVRVNIPDGCQDACCKTDLKKIELNVKPQCKVPGVKVSATVNGVPTDVAPSFDSPKDGAEGATILRITQLGLGLTDDGTQVCITLSPNNAGEGCTTLESLCQPPTDGSAVCSAALFDTSLGCCPISPVFPGYVAPPPPPVVPAESTCTTCATFSLVPSTAVIEPVKLTPAQCQSLAFMVYTDMMAVAESMGVNLGNQTARYTCSDNSMQVCNVFPADGGIEMLQPWIENAVQIWWGRFSDSCPAYYQPYTLSVNVYSYTSGGGYCLSADYTSNCELGPVDYPACTCDTHAGATPFFVSPYVEVSDGRSNSTKLHCFTTKVNTPNEPDSFCGKTTTLLKAEVYANYDLRSKLRGIGLRAAGDTATRFISPSWGPRADQTLKVTPLRWNTTHADGGRICLELDQSVALQDFCMLSGPTCLINLFDNSKRCCPLFPASP